MVSKIYNVSGFECPVCAGKTVKYILKKEGVESANLDFENGKIEICFKDNAWSAEELQSVIAEFETDPITVTE